MGCTSSSPDELVPAPLPLTVEEWARVGVPGLLRAHAWLRSRAAVVDGGKRRVRMSYFVRPLPPAPAGEGLPVEEDAASLRGVASNVGNAARGAPNLLHHAYFVRAASWLVANAGILRAHFDATFLLPLAPSACPTLSPELPPAAVKSLLRTFRAACGGGGLLDKVDLAALLGDEKASLVTSVFFPLLFTACVGAGEAAAAAAGSGAEDPPPLDAAAWVTGVDALCSLSETQLVRLAFFALARVGVGAQVVEGWEPAPGGGPPPTPFIAVSSLPRCSAPLWDAARDRTHCSRPLLDELRLRREGNRRNARGGGGEGAPARRAKEAAFAALLAAVARGARLPRQRGAAPRGGGGGGGARTGAPTMPSADDWGDEADRARAAALAAALEPPRSSWSSAGASRVAAALEAEEPLCEGPEDLLSWADFASAFKASPVSFFDLLYFQRLLRKVRGKGRSNTTHVRAARLQTVRARSPPNVAHARPQKTLGEGFWVSRCAEAQKAQASALHGAALHGYDPAWAAPQPHPALLPTLHRALHVPRLQVPAALAWALNVPRAARPQAAPPAEEGAPAPAAPAPSAPAAPAPAEEDADPLPPAAAARSSEPQLPTRVHLPSLQVPVFEGASPEGGGAVGGGGEEEEEEKEEEKGGEGGGAGGQQRPVWVSPQWSRSVHGGGGTPGVAAELARGGLRLFPPPAQQEPPPREAPLSPPPGLLPPGLSIIVPESVGEDGRVRLFQRPPGAPQAGLHLGGAVAPRRQLGAAATPAAPPGTTTGGVRLFPRPGERSEQTL
jgi:hypothetical protein